MADIRIKDLTTTASSTASDDFIAVDGATNGTRKLNAYSPSFGGNATVAGAMNVGGVITTDAEYLQGSNVNFNIRSTATNGNVYLKSNGGTLYLNNTAGNGDIRLGNTGNVVTVVGTTASTTTSTGALVVSGGVGVAGNIYAGGNTFSLSKSGDNPAIKSTDGTIITKVQSVSVGDTAGYIGTESLNTLKIVTNNTAALTVSTAQQVTVNATTASTSTSSGALVVSGGVGVAKEVYVGKTCKVGTGSDNEGYTNVFTNKAENTAGPFDITLPSDCVGVVFLNSYQGGVGRSFREIPFICFGGTVTLGTSRTTVLTADPVTSVAAAASSKITISLYAANTNCYWGIYVNKS